MVKYWMHIIYTCIILCVVEMMHGIYTEKSCVYIVNSKTLLVSSSQLYYKNVDSFKYKIRHMSHLPFHKHNS